MAPIERFLGRPLEGDDDPGEAILRYLRAYGPAAPKDVRAWCYKTGLREVIDRLRPELVTYRDENGTELLDVPDGEYSSRPTCRRRRGSCPSTTTPSCRTTIAAGIPPGRRAGLGGRARCWSTASSTGTWSFEREKDSATLAIGPWSEWRKPDREAVEAEGDRLLAFAAADAAAMALRIEPV